MATPPKLVRHGPDKRRSFQIVQSAFEEVKVLDMFPRFDFNQLQCAISMKYGYDLTAKLVELLSRVCIQGVSKEMGTKTGEVIP